MLPVVPVLVLRMEAGPLVLAGMASVLLPVLALPVQAVVSVLEPAVVQAVVPVLEPAVAGSAFLIQELAVA